MIATICWSWRSSLPCSSSSFSSKLRVRREKLADADKGSNVQDTGLHGPFAVEHIRGHEDAVLREDVREISSATAPVFEVADCDLKELDSFLGQLEGEIRRKSLQIAFDLLVETLGAETVEVCKLGIDHHALAAWTVINAEMLSMAEAVSRVLEFLNSTPSSSSTGLTPSGRLGGFQVRVLDVLFDRLAAGGQRGLGDLGDALGVRACCGSGRPRRRLRDRAGPRAPSRRRACRGTRRRRRRLRSSSPDASGPGRA